MCSFQMVSLPQQILQFELSLNLLLDLFYPLLLGLQYNSFYRTIQWYKMTN